MTQVLIATLSILVLTLLVRVFDRISPIKVCAICAGVTLTWAWMFVAMWFGILYPERYEIIIAILMGASIGGIVNELKKLSLKFHAAKKSVQADELQKQMDSCC